MTDVDPLLRAALRRHADGAPPADGLLAAVHARSAGLRRRRRVAMVSAALAAVVALGTGTALATTIQHGVRVGWPPVGSNGNSTRPASTPPVTSTGPTSPSPSRTPIGDAHALRLDTPAYQVPTFPFRLGADAPAMRSPVITMVRGELQAYYEAVDPEKDADVTLVTGARHPTFGIPAGPVTEVARSMRDHIGKLRNEAVSPAAQLTAYWQESANLWVQLRTDDTYTPDQLIKLVNGLVADSAQVAVPLRFDWAPKGLVPDTMTPSIVGFVPSTGTAGAEVVTCTLSRARSLSGASVPVGSYHGVLRHDGGTTLTVALTDWHITLTVRIASGYTMTDADLARFAAGIQVTERAEPTASG
jgi:hypothetical protein